MTTSLVECVPNFSEGRDQAILDGLHAALSSVNDAAVLNRHADRHHHRSVFTIVGTPDAVAESAVRGVETATQLIDLTKHKGVHPRIGVADVIPFVPIHRSTLSDCIALAKATARRIGKACSVPAFLYAQASNPPGRQLASLRRGETQGLHERLRTALLTPDYGPNQLHPTAGATAVGARGFLVAYNIELDTDDVVLGRKVAAAIRESSGGMRGVQAKCFLVNNRAQVSINLLDLAVTTPVMVFDAVVTLAQRLDSRVRSSEIVGLAPRAALPDEADRRLILRNVNRVVLEDSINDEFGINVELSLQTTGSI